MKTYERAPQPETPRSPEPERRLAPPIYSLEHGEENFREPEDGELIVGNYRENDRTPAPLLWADLNVDLFWDITRLEHLKPPCVYLKLSEQP